MRAAPLETPSVMTGTAAEAAKTAEQRAAARAVGTNLFKVFLLLTAGWPKGGGAGSGAAGHPANKSSVGSLKATLQLRLTLMDGFRMTENQMPLPGPCEGLGQGLGTRKLRSYLIVHRMSAARPSRTSPVLTPRKAFSALQPSSTAAFTLSALALRAASSPSRRTRKLA